MQKLFKGFLALPVSLIVTACVISPLDDKAVTTGQSSTTSPQATGPSADPGKASQPSMEPSVEPGNTYPVTPVYQQSQSYSTAETIANDGKEHEVRVLFVDKFKLRVEGNKFISLANDTQAQQGVNSIAFRHGPVTLAPVPSAMGKSEEELDRLQAEEQAQAQSFVPHRGSWAVVTLEDYTPEKALSLFSDFDASVYVQSVEVVGVPGR